MYRISFIYLTFLCIIFPVSLAFAEIGGIPVCPQDRKTPQAPPEFLNLKNPLQQNKETLAAGKQLYEQSAQPLQCKVCHGVKGNGLGEPGFESNPPARNFTCSKTVKNLSDGQLFWVIKNGSPGTVMMGYSDLKDEDIWKLILYIREFAK